MDRHHVYIRLLHGTDKEYHMEMQCHPEAKIVEGELGDILERFIIYQRNLDGEIELEHPGIAQDKILPLIIVNEMHDKLNLLKIIADEKI